MAKREQSQLQSEVALHYVYCMLLVGKLRVAHIPVPVAPQIPGRGPIIPSFKPDYMPVPSGPLGGWGSFSQALGPSQDPGYTSGTSGGTGPSIGPFVGDDDDTNTDQYLKGDGSP